MLTQDEILQWDREDPLAHHRDAFVLPEGVIYLDGNSLGPLPCRARDRMSQVVEREWGEGLIRSWNDAGWYPAATRLGAKVAPLVGANPEEVIVTDSMSVNLYKLLVGWLGSRSGNHVILCEQDSFPTDLYILDSVAEFLPNVEIQRASRERLLEQLQPGISVVFLSHVDYRSAYLWEMHQVTRRAHDVGAWTVWNLAHSAGAMPLRLGHSKVDAAVGCGYKYLNGGPGAPSFVYVAQRHQEKLDQPQKGWFGHAAPFEFSAEYEPAKGIRKMLCGTPPVLSMAALEASLEDWQAVDMEAVRVKSVRLSELFRQLVLQECGSEALELSSPLDPDCRGSHLAFRHPQAYGVIQALIAEGVIGDFRGPDLVRFGFAPLYLRYQDIWEAIKALSRILRERRYLLKEFQQKKSVT